MGNPYSRAKDVDPGSRANFPPLPDGEYDVLEILNSSDFKGQGQNSKKHFFKATLRTLDGTIGTFFAQIDGDDYNGYYDLQELANVKQYVGKALGHDTIAQINAAVDEDVLAKASGGDGKYLAGKFVGARVTSTTKGDGVRYAKYDFRLPKGAPAAPTTPQATAPKSAVAAPPPVASAPPPVAGGVPAGWTKHPANPLWMYETVNPTNQKLIAG